jgi:hypothetical protein
MYFTDDQGNKTTLVDPVKDYADSLNGPPFLADGESRVRVVFMNK